jgi:hypothetical protein
LASAPVAEVGIEEDAIQPPIPVDVVLPDSHTAAARR